MKSRAKLIDNIDNYDLRNFCHYNYLHYPSDRKLRPYVKSLKLSNEQEKELYFLANHDRVTHIFQNLLFLLYIPYFFIALFFFSNFFVYLLFTIAYVSVVTLFEYLITRYRDIMKYWDRKKKGFDYNKWLNFIIYDMCAFKCAVRAFLGFYTCRKRYYGFVGE